MSSVPYSEYFLLFLLPPPLKILQDHLTKFYTQLSEILVFYNMLSLLMRFPSPSGKIQIHEGGQFNSLQSDSWKIKERPVFKAHRVQSPYSTKQASESWGRKWLVFNHVASSKENQFSLAFTVG